MERDRCFWCNLQTPVVKLLDPLTAEQQLYACAGLVLLSFILLIIARFSFRYAAPSRHLGSTKPRSQRGRPLHFSGVKSSSLFFFYLNGADVIIVDRVDPLGRGYNGKLRNYYSHHAYVTPVMHQPIRISGVTVIHSSFMGIFWLCDHDLKIHSRKICF